MALYGSHHRGYCLLVTVTTTLQLSASLPHSPRFSLPLLESLFEFRLREVLVNLFLTILCVERQSVLCGEIFVRVVYKAWMTLHNVPHICFLFLFNFRHIGVMTEVLVVKWLPDLSCRYGFLCQRFRQTQTLLYLSLLGVINNSL